MLKKLSLHYFPIAYIHSDNGSEFFSIYAKLGG